MSAALPPPTRRGFLATSATALLAASAAGSAFGLLPAQLAFTQEVRAAFRSLR